MRRLPSLFLGIVLIVVAVAIGVTAYNAGYDRGLEASGSATQVVRYVGPGFGFFPFGFLLFPLLFFLIFGFFGRRRWRHDEHHGTSSKVEDRFDEWHRRQHDDRPATSAGA